MEKRLEDPDGAGGAYILVVYGVREADSTMVTGYATSITDQVLEMGLASGFANGIGSWSLSWPYSSTSIIWMFCSLKFPTKCVYGDFL
jgi:hypothetical protein